MTNNLASRELLLAACPRRYTTTMLPSSGATVRMQSLSEAEAAKIDAATYDYKTGAIDKAAALASRTRLIVACVVDAEGHRLFTDDDAALLLERMDAADSKALWQACVAHVEGRGLRATLKNSSATAGDDSP